MFVDYDYSNTAFNVVSPNYEVSNIQWKNIEDCLSSIRSYNLEKKAMISGVNQVLTQYVFK
jgi:hypothetical protein